MSTLYTAYKFKLDEDTSKRPCGMNNLVYLDRKYPSPRKQREVCELPYIQGYDTVVFFEDEKSIRTIELW